VFALGGARWARWAARHRQAPGSDQSDTYATEDAPHTTLSCHHIARVALPITSACRAILEIPAHYSAAHTRRCPLTMTYSSPLPSFSSPASSRLPAARRASFSGQLAFLVHSQETVANHMPPDVDNKALARQKRRRTRYVANSPTSVLPSARGPCSTRAGSCATYSGSYSAYYPAGKRHSNMPSPLTTTSCSKEDEDILKSEYLKNPKPSKAARLEIVKKVALGEKEVQVRPMLLHVTSVRAPANLFSSDLVPE
jgi:hypothetical protein